MKSLQFIILFALLGLFSVSQAQFVQPTTGEVSSPIGDRVHPTLGTVKYHKGLDYAADIGTDVVASYEGTVRYGNDPEGYGTYIYIEHDNGLVTLYGHLNERSVPEGTRVQTGQKIGELGNTGRSTGPHLHFEITEGFLGPVYSPGGVTWDQAAGIGVGQGFSARSAINIDPAGLPETEVAQGEEEYPCLSPEACAFSETGSSSIPASTDEQAALDAATDEGSAGILEPIDLDNSSGSVGVIIPKPEEWINETTAIMNEFNLAANLNRVAMALLFLFFVYSLLNITYYYQSDQYLILFGRLIIASGLIFAAPVIGDQTVKLWEGVYDTMTTRVVQPATTSLEQEMNALTPRLTAAAGITVALKVAGGLSPDVIPGDGLIDEASALSGAYTKGIYAIMVLMGSLYGIYLLVIYSAAMTVILANMLLPVMAAFLMLPGSGSWTNKWISMVVLSFVTVVTFSFVYSVAIEVGVVGPTKGMSEALRNIGTQIQNLQSAFPNPVAVIGAIQSAVGAIKQLMIQWLFGLVFLAIGVLASIYLLKQLPSLLQGFLGGVTGQAANAASGAALGAFLGGVGGTLAAGMNSSKTSSPDNTGSKPALTPGGSRAGSAQVNNGDGGRVSQTSPVHRGNFATAGKMSDGSNLKQTVETKAERT